MDDRTLTTAMAGALLVAASVLRAQDAADRAVQANLRRELQRFGHTWRRRLDNLGSVTGGIIGVGVLVYAFRANLRAHKP